MASFFSIDELLGNSNQDTTLTFRAKPLQVGGEKSVQPIQKADKTGKGFDDIITSPTVRDMLANVAIGLDPKGVGGALGLGAKAQLESEQFGKMIAKIESGQELEVTDVIGLSPQAQQQAFNIIQAKGVAGRAERQLGLQEAAAPGQRGLTDVRAAQIAGAGEQRLSEIEAKGKVDRELERLKQAGDANWRLDKQLFADRVDYGIINQKTGERKSIAVGDPSPRDLGIFDQGGGRGETGKKITGADLDLLSRAVQTTKTFKILADKVKFGIGDIFGAQQAGGASADPVEFARRLSKTGMSNEKFKELVGREPTINEIQDIAEINRFAQQAELFQQQTEFQPQLPSGAGRGVQPPSQVNDASQFMTNTIASMTTEQQDEYVNSIPPDILQLIDVFLTNNRKALSSKNRAIVHAKNFSGRN